MMCSVNEIFPKKTQLTENSKIEKKKLEYFTLLMLLDTYMKVSIVVNENLIS